MGTAKKEASRKVRQSASSTESNSIKTGNLRVKGENFYRDAAKVKQVNLLRGGRPVRDRAGKIIKAAPLQSKEVPKARVQPDRRWFNSTRVISQDVLTEFRNRMQEHTSNPYNLLLKRSKLPLSLLKPSELPQKFNVIEQESFEDTFGKNARRKRPKIDFSSVKELSSKSKSQQKEYSDRVEELEEECDEDGFADGFNRSAREPIFQKGQSRRIWSELHKVIDSSDVIIHVLDARNPLGTRCLSIENHITNDCPHKHLIYVLNKCDLIPSSVAASWVSYLSRERPTIAFHASINNSFGKGTLIQLLRQYSAIHNNRKQISCGIVGYPNTGKSSIINTLRRQKVCNVAPIPGETKVWQYVTLMKRIYLIDCPGVVPPSKTDTDEDILLRGVVRVEKVEHPEQFIAAVLERCKAKYVQRTYEIEAWSDAHDFLARIAKKTGRLLKGGEPDEAAVAKMVLNDFLRGRLPWFVPPPDFEAKDSSEQATIASEDLAVSEE